MVETVIASVAFSLVTGILYLYVGTITQERQLRGAAAAALKAFGFWWYGLGVFTLIAAMNPISFLLGFDDRAVASSVTYVSILPLTVALVCIIYYLLYLYTGRAGLLKLIVAFYSAYYAFLMYVIAYQEPSGLVQEGWNVTVQYANELPPVLGFALAATLLVPVIVAAFLYGSLFFQLRDRTKRFRVALVSVAFLFWFGTSLAASATGLDEAPWWPPVSRVIGLLAPILVIIAYRPPAWLRHRAGIEAAGEQQGTP